MRRSRPRRLMLLTMLGSLLWVGAVLANGAKEHPNADVRFVVAVELTKGHLTVSQAVYEAGQRSRAIVHAAHPVQELGRLVYAPPTQVSAELGERVRAMMKKPGQAIEANVSSAEYAETIKQVFATLDEAIARVVSEATRSAPAFGLTVVAELLRSVAEEYEAAFADGKIILEVEYQDAVGFLNRARALFATTQSRVPPKAARTIDRELTTLAGLLPGVTAPAAPAPPARVKQSVRSVLFAVDAVARAPAGGERRQ